MNKATVSGTFMTRFEVPEGVNPLEAANIFLEDIKAWAEKKGIVFIINATTISDKRGTVTTDLKQAKIREPKVRKT